jgi:hypothetical protein
MIVVSRVDCVNRRVLGLGPRFFFGDWDCRAVGHLAVEALEPSGATLVLPQA